MKKQFLLVLVAVLAVFALPWLVSCSPVSSTTTTGFTNTGTFTPTVAVTPFVAVDSSTAYAPFWLDPPIVGVDGTLTIPLSAVQKDIIVHFRVTSAANQQETFMAYYYDGLIYVRGDDCVPCQSINFSLKGNLLVCNSCGTTFNAITGKGTGTVGSPQCRTYPKEIAAYTIQGDQIVMHLNDLDTTFQNTITKG